MSTPSSIIVPPVAVITGFLGAGKTTLAEQLQNQHAEQIRRAVTYTTRTPREGEIPGVHYNFIDEPTFEKLAQEGHFFETNRLPTGYSYATPHFHHVGATEGQTLLYVIDPNGALYFKQHHPPTEVFFLYVTPEEQRRRLLHERGNDPTVEKRLAHYDAERQLLEQNSHLFHVLRNEEPDDLTHALAHVQKTLQLG